MTVSSSIFTDKVMAMQPYHVQNSGGLIKLDAMESPYTLPDEMRQALGTVLSMTHINRYPNSKSTSLAATIKSRFVLPESCDVLLGNGSDELIQIILTATARPNATVLSPVPSFVMYQQTAELLGMNFVGVDLQADFSLDEAAFLAAIKTHQPAVIFLAYPNNPTGFSVSEQTLQNIIEATEGLVVIDEAYAAYASKNAITFIEQYNHVVLIRTLSKIGLAGIRLGYLAAKPALVEQFEKVRMPYNINILTQATARFMLDQMTYLNNCVNKIMREKESLYQWLNEQENIYAYPSETNFLLVRFTDADTVFNRLRDEYKILVKNLTHVHPTLRNTLRITIGRKKENTKLREALSDILNSLR